MAIKFEGLDDVLKSLDGLDSTKLEAAIGKATMLVEREARIKAPKDNGELKRSIESRVESGGSNIQGIVFTTLEYAPYVEYGTGCFAEGGNGRSGYWVYVKDSSKRSSSGGKTYTLEEAKRAVAAMRKKGLDAYYTCGQKPQPYMRPALDENREEILRIIKEGLLND